MHAAIPMMMREGRKQSQAIAIAHSVWENKNKKHKANINKDFNVKYLAGMSKDRSTVYIDKGLDETVNVDGKEVDPVPYLAIHECTEAWHMDQGEDYQTAHKYASDAEQVAVEADGIDWHKYNAALEPFIKVDDDEDEGFPPDLDLQPYLDEGE